MFIAFFVISGHILYFLYDFTCRCTSTLSRCIHLFFILHILDMSSSCLYGKSRCVDLLFCMFQHWVVQIHLWRTAGLDQRERWRIVNRWPRQRSEGHSGSPAQACSKPLLYYHWSLICCKQFLPSFLIDVQSPQGFK